MTDNNGIIILFISLFYVPVDGCLIFVVLILPHVVIYQEERPGLVTHSFTDLKKLQGIISWLEGICLA